MLQQLKNGSSTVQEMYTNCVQHVNKIKILNAYVRVTEKVSQAQLIESTERYSKGIITISAA